MTPASTHGCTACSRSSLVPPPPAGTPVPPQPRRCALLPGFFHRGPGRGGASPPTQDAGLPRPARQARSVVTREKGVGVRRDVSRLIKAHAHTEGKFADRMRANRRTEEETSRERSLLAREPGGLRLGKGAKEAPTQLSRPQQVRHLERRGKEPRATHLTEKRWAGRSPPPPEGSPRCTIPSPASFFASLRSRADNYMSKWHIPFRAHREAPSAQARVGARGGRARRARCTGSERG